MFAAIRHCNIFLENAHVPRDIIEEERQQWIAEVKFLKAYYHFFLLRLYGPIPLIKENIPLSANPEEVKVFRSLLMRASIISCSCSMRPYPIYL